MENGVSCNYTGATVSERDPILNSELFGYIQEYLASDRDRSDIVMTSRIKEDLGLDSMGILEFIIAVEEKTGTRIDDLPFYDAQTIGEVFTMLHEALARAQAKKERKRQSWEQYVTTTIHGTISSLRRGIGSVFSSLGTLLPSGRTEKSSHVPSPRRAAGESNTPHG